MILHLHLLSNYLYMSWRDLTVQFNGTLPHPNIQLVFNKEKKCVNRLRSCIVILQRKQCLVNNSLTSQALLGIYKKLYITSTIRLDDLFGLDILQCNSISPTVTWSLVKFSEAVLG